MGYFRNCIHCGQELQKPTASEDLVYGWNCPRCGKGQERAMSLEEWVAELFDEIDSMKRKLRRD